MIRHMTERIARITGRAGDLRRSFEERLYGWGLRLRLRLLHDAGERWWHEASVHKRNALLEALATRHFTCLSIEDQARAICGLAHRYGASDWLFDRDLERMPPNYFGTPLELMFRLYRLSVPMPPSERELRAILTIGRSARAKELDRRRIGRIN